MDALYTRGWTLMLNTFFGVLFSIQPAFSQSERLVPDRPGFSTGTFTVEPGSFYTEFGYQFSFGNNNFVRESELPIITLRTGLASGAELFANWDGIGYNHSADETDTGLPSLGSKVRILQ